MRRKYFSLIKENATLDAVMDIVKEGKSYHFPGINSQNNLIGLMSLGTLRNTFSEEHLNPIVLARDIFPRE